MTPAIYYIIATVLAVTIAIGFAKKDGWAPLESKRYHGTVRYIFDGDTLSVTLRGGQELKIRLWGVDAPERNQKGFQRAKIALQRMSENQPVSLIRIDIDRYGRIVARVFLKDGREINRMMIEQGAAREYMRYSKGFYGG